MIKLFLLALLPTFIFCNYVIDLSDNSLKDFENELKKHELVIIKFFVPWCGHCNQLKPEYESAAKNLKDNPSVTLAEVDCTSKSGKDLCDHYSISGYPTIKVYQHGEFSEYKQDRSSAAIVNYVKLKLKTSKYEFKSFAEIKKKLSSENDVVVLGIFDSESDEFSKEFFEVSEKFKENTTFFYIYNNAASDSIKEILQADLKTGIVLFRPKFLGNKFESLSVVYDKKDVLENFINSNYHGLVGIRTNSNVKSFGFPLIVAYYDVDYKNNAKTTNYWRNRILIVAQEFKAKGLNFAISHKTPFSSELDYLDQSREKKTPIVIAKEENNKRYIFTEEFSSENLKKFAQDFLDGKLKPFIKSEEIPKDNSEPVKVAVGSTFDELVTNSEKDVFVEFYASWCGHCKNLEPIYKKLGEKLKDEPNIEIVKIEAMKNEYPSHIFKVEGFPTLYFLPSGDKKPIKYTGKREVDDFISFIAEHATSELKGFNRDGSPKSKEEL